MSFTRIPYNHIYTNKMCHLHAYHTITFTPTRCVIYTHTIQSYLHQQDVLFTRIPYNHICTNKMCYLTHWIRVTHICVSKQTRIGSNNGLSPGWRQAIIWTNAGILFIGPLRTNFNEISIEIHILPRPQCDKHSFKALILGPVTDAIYVEATLLLFTFLLPFFLQWNLENYELTVSARILMQLIGGNWWKSLTFRL